LAAAALMETYAFMIENGLDDRELKLMLSFGFKQMGQICFATISQNPISKPERSRHVPLLHRRQPDLNLP
jgi:hypothetical protein